MWTITLCGPLHYVDHNNKVQFVEEKMFYSVLWLVSVKAQQRAGPEFLQPEENLLLNPEPSPDPDSQIPYPETQAGSTRHFADPGQRPAYFEWFAKLPATPILRLTIKSVTIKVLSV